MGFKCKVFSSDVAEETIEDLKKDSFVKSSFLTHTSVSTYICSAPYGPHLWTSEATFEDDDKASGIATKLRLNFDFDPRDVFMKRRVATALCGVSFLQCLSLCVC